MSTAQQPSTPPRRTQPALVIRSFKWVVSSVLAKVIVGLLLAAFAISTTVINHDELAILTRFGRNLRAPLDPGLHFYLPFITEIRRYPTTLQFLLITDKAVQPDVTFEEVHFKEGVAVTTTDGVDARVVLEVVYQIQKSEATVDAFVESFGRIDSEYGTAKIEKLIADTTRGLTRQLLSNAQLNEVENEGLKYSALIRDASNGKPVDLGIAGRVLKGQLVALQAPSLSSLGVTIQRLGYRVMPNQEFAAVRNRSAAQLEHERARIAQIAARKTADLLEAAAEEEVLARKAQLAKARKEVFDNSPDGDIDKLVAQIIRGLRGLVWVGWVWASRVGAARGIDRCLFGA